MVDVSGALIDGRGRIPPDLVVPRMSEDEMVRRIGRAMEANGARRIAPKTTSRPFRDFKIITGER